MPLALNLTRFRAIADTALPDTAAIQRRTRVSDGRGGTTLGAWAAVSGLEAVACRYMPAPVLPREREGTNQVQAIAYWNFTFPAGTDVRSTDRIVVGSRTFEVVVGGAHSYEVARRVTALEIV